MNTSSINRGDIYYAIFENKSNKQAVGIRPVLVIQNNIANKFAPYIIVAPITSVKNKKLLPTHEPISSKESGLVTDCTILLDAIATIDKKYLKDKVSSLSKEKLKKVSEKLFLSICDDFTYDNSTKTVNVAINNKQANNIDDSLLDDINNIPPSNVYDNSIDRYRNFNYTMNKDMYDSINYIKKAHSPMSNFLSYLINTVIGIGLIFLGIYIAQQLN